MTRPMIHESSSSRIAWTRIAIAALLSELGVIATLSITIGAVMVMAPRVAAEQSTTLGETVGYYVAPAAGAVTTFLAVLWAVRGRSSRFLTHGLLIGVGSVILTLGFLFGARPEHYAMYLVAFALRLLAGALAGAYSGWRLDSATPKATAAKIA